MSNLRLCLIGNSHLAAMKLGWDALVEAGDPVVDGIEITYFGAPRDMLRNLKVEEGALVPTTDAVRAQFATLSGQEVVSVADYDVFLLVGLGASFKRVLRLYSGLRWFGLRGRQNLPLVSAEFARDFLIEGYRSTRLADLGTKLASLTDKPMFAFHEPYWSPRTSPCPNDKDFGWLKAVDQGDGAALASIFQASLKRATEECTHLLPQPASTIEDDIMTRPEFNRNAEKDISGTGGGADAAHMNKDYGIELWRKHLETVRNSA